MAQILLLGELSSKLQQQVQNLPIPFGLSLLGVNESGRYRKIIAQYWTSSRQNQWLLRDMFN